MPAAIEYDAPDKSAIEWETTPPPMPTPRPTQPTQKVKKANAVWLAADELLMAQLLLEDKRASTAGDNKFKSSTWTKVAKALEEQREDGGYKSSEACRQKHGQLKSRFNMFALAKNNGPGVSGFGWDAERNRLSACKATWAHFLEKHPKYSVIRNKPFPLYKIYDELVGGTSATGRNVVRPGQPWRPWESQETPGGADSEDEGEDNEDPSEVLVPATQTLQALTEVNTNIPSTPAPNPRPKFTPQSRPKGAGTPLIRLRAKITGPESIVALSGALNGQIGSLVDVLKSHGSQSQPVDRKRKLRAEAMIYIDKCDFVSPRGIQQLYKRLKSNHDLAEWIVDMPEGDSKQAILEEWAYEGL